MSFQYYGGLNETFSPQMSFLNTWIHKVWNHTMVSRIFLTHTFFWFSLNTKLSNSAASLQDVWPRLATFLTNFVFEQRARPRLYSAVYCGCSLFLRGGAVVSQPHPPYTIKCKESQSKLCTLLKIGQI